jgi:DnaJ-class molecular chaperone
MSALKTVKIRIQVQCDECKGSGELYFPLTEHGDSESAKICPQCEGDGHATMMVPLLTLKHLLEGGDL